MEKPRDGAFLCSTNFASRCGLLVDDYIAALNGRHRISGVPCPQLVVVHDSARGPIPNLDPELVHAATAIDLSVNSGEDECVVAGPVYRPRAFVLGPGAGHDQPLVASAVEVQTCHTKLKFGRSGWRASALLVPGYEAKVRSSCKIRIRRISTNW
jgi:hypothetical protein